MRRTALLFSTILLYSLLAPAQRPPVVIVSSPDKSVYFDGETVTLDGSLSYARDGAYLVHYNWYIDNVFYRDAAVTTKTFELSPGEVTRAVSVRLEVIDSYLEEASRTVGFTLHRRPRHYYYLTDHLGSVRATVKGGEVMVTDNFNSGTLSQWTVVQGGGFSVQSGELSNWSGGDNYMINSSVKTFTDGILTADVKNVSSPNAGASLIARYQDNNNFYLIAVGDQNYVAIFKKLNGAWSMYSQVFLNPPLIPGVWHRLQATLEGGAIKIYWDGVLRSTWTDPAPWLSGKVGFRQCASQNVRWDNFTATSGGPGQIASSDDFDAWGYTLDGRSTNNGDTQARYKFLAKEHDTESGYEWLESRGYDARIGRFFTVDPLADLAKLRAWAPYQYSRDNPMTFVDPTGMDDERPWWQQKSDEYFGESNISRLVSGFGNYVRNLFGWANGPKPERKSEEQQEEERQTHQGLTEQEQALFQYEGAENYLVNQANANAFAASTCLTLTGFGAVGKWEPWFFAAKSVTLGIYQDWVSSSAAGGLRPWNTLAAAAPIPFARPLPKIGQVVAGTTFTLNSRWNWQTIPTPTRRIQWK